MIRNRLITRGILGAATIAAVYAAGWFIVANVLRTGIADWKADRRAEGWIVEHGAIDIGGFPFAWRAAIDSPHLAPAGGRRSFHWTGPAIALSWKPWSPRMVAYTTSGTHTFRTDPSPHTDRLETTLEIASGQGRLTFKPHGRLDRLTILIDDGRLALADGQSLRFNRLHAAIGNDPPANGAKPAQPHLVPSFRLSGELFGLTLPAARQRPPLGRTIGRIALDGTIMGHIPPGRPSQSLPVWQQDGGTVEISHLDLGWGPLDVRTTGTLALDSALQPVAALNGTFTGYGETLEALVRARLIKPNVGRIGKFALSALARPSRTGARREIRVPVTLQQRWLYVGPVKLLRMPTIRWK